MGWTQILMDSFNNTFSWIAPKNKVYCGTQLLQTRLSIGIGIQGLALLEYFKKLFVKLGIDITSNVLNYLSVKENKQTKRINKVKETETKKQRLQSKFEQLKQHEAIAKKERAKREGTYKTGINMEGVSNEEVNNNNKNRIARKSVICKHCGKKGHSTTRSKKCLKHNDNTLVAELPPAAAVAPAWTQEEENRLLLRQPRMMLSMLTTWIPLSFLKGKAIPQQLPMLMMMKSVVSSNSN